MKVTLLLPLMLFGVYALEAEFIVRDIDFSNFNGDGDNDYVNNFNSNDYSYSPTLTYGGSQGSILPPAYTSWANTLARYRYSANPTIGETMVFSVDFLYDSSLVNPNSNERPVGIFLEGNHGVKAYIETNGNLTISSYYWNNNNWYSGDPYETYGSTVNLSDDEWYRLTLTIDVIGGQFGDQTNITAEVHELNNFTSVGNAGGKLYDILFIDNENISVGLHGSLWGGASRLDNFHFEASTNDQITDNGIDSDNDGIIDANDEFPNDPSESLDTDDDGVGDNSDEFPTIPTQDLVNAIKSNPTRYNLYSIDDIKDLRPGSTMIEVSGNQATVQLQMEESSDLESWTETGDPATMTIPVPAEAGTKFFRFKMTD